MRTAVIRGRLSAQRSAWTVLQHPDFHGYFVGSLVSNLGTWLQNTAQVLLAYQLTGSALDAGIVTAAQYAGALLGPWAAVIAARVGGKRMLIGIQLIAATLAATLAVLQWAGALTEPVLIAGALGLGLAFTFGLPVQTALLSRLVPEGETEAAMTMNSVSYNAGRAIAPVLCILVVVFIGFGWAFALNAISFVVFARMLARAHPRPVGTTLRPPRARDGVSIAWQEQRIILLLCMVAAVTLADDPVLVLGPALAHQLGVSHDWAGYFLSALGAGTVLASFAPARVSAGEDASQISRRAAVALATLALSMMVFAADVGTWTSMLAALVAGGAGLTTGAAAQSIMVRKRPEQAASVMALWAIAWAGSKPIASLLDGWLASQVGVTGAGVILAAPAIVLALLEMFLPRVRKGQIKAIGKRLNGRQPVRAAVGTERQGFSTGRRVSPVTDTDPASQRAEWGLIEVGASGMSTTRKLRYPFRLVTRIPAPKPDRDLRLHGVQLSQESPDPRLVTDLSQFKNE